MYLINSEASNLNQYLGDFLNLSKKKKNVYRLDFYVSLSLADTGTISQMWSIYRREKNILFPGNFLNCRS